MQINHIPPASISPRSLALTDTKPVPHPINLSSSSLAQTQAKEGKSLPARSIEEICVPVDLIDQNNSIAQGICDMFADAKLSLDKRLELWILMKNYIRDKKDQKLLLDQIVKTAPSNPPGSEGKLVQLMISLNYDSPSLKELEPFITNKYDQADYINSYCTKIEAEKNQDIKNRASLDFCCRNLHNYPSVQLLHTMASNTLGSQELYLFFSEVASCTNLDTLFRINAISAVSKHKPEEASALALRLSEEVKTNGVNTELSPHASSPQAIIMNYKDRLLGLILSPQEKQKANINLQHYLKQSSKSA